MVDEHSYDELLARIRKDLALDLGTDPVQPLVWNGPARFGAPQWITPTLLNSWVNYGAGYDPAGYLKDPLGFVHLRGQIKSGTVNSTVFVLPVGYRPSGQNQFANVDNGGGGTYGTVAAVYVDGAGTVSIFGSQAPTFATLSGITFLAEQ